mmetsp:Transcript_36898/g.56663  ORF Transcript_36898/g.56663 Transcript_36898/m.56663 type:complete len:505 (-) Transcript_36898:134-1648(-)|eukprot:CAMPEP_0118694778 /NCGR_PEP_ID=MMETSP0800-20121206/12758_1 /TAXON_ID=210618 ORGANISM="Striatella unipunctata, Strain CCMP2910" /NCGR_SAMPLE_ID=MMETSP0800 /ASSEMBLY_ACC=CAM_ASM_000638 /LENGTH=504 /DNA_ID=CAMNT_0006593373 /DNA_START=211 /DNA_END=1725 /DNA_ORIENTATION=+
MILSTAMLASVASLMLQACAGQGVSSKLQVHIPQTLTRPDGYAHKEALFGVPPYGGSIQQNVYFANDLLCEPNVDTRGGFPIRPKDKSDKMEPWPAPYILLVDRGGCTFVKKVRNAQRSGAAGVIIADDRCLCSAGSSCTSAQGEQCETREPIMADDGSGSDISIPSFLMYKQDADPVKAELMANRPVRIEMAWALPHPDNRVEYQLWASPTDRMSHEFLKQFKKAAVALAHRAKFTPHIFVYNGVKSGCKAMDGENVCYSLCTNYGRYCATDPDNDLQKGISGADVVKESLRRACIWETYGSDGIGEQWWDYIVEFLFRCNTDPNFASDACIADAYSNSGVDAAEIEKCMKASGGLEIDAKNTLMEAELTAADEAGIVILPAAFVNGAAIRGALSFSTIFKAICAGFSKKSVPDVCLQCANCANEYDCVVNGGCAGASSQSVSMPVFIGSMVVLVVVFICVGLIQYRRSQNQVRAEVRGIIAEYMPLDNNSKVVSALDEGEIS